MSLSFTSFADSVHQSGLEAGVIIIIRSSRDLEDRAQVVAGGMDSQMALARTIADSFGIRVARLKEIHHVRRRIFIRQLESKKTSQ